MNIASFFTVLAIVATVAVVSASSGNEGDTVPVDSSLVDRNLFGGFAGLWTSGSNPFNRTDYTVKVEESISTQEGRAGLNYYGGKKGGYYGGRYYGGKKGGYYERYYGGKKGGYYGGKKGGYYGGKKGGYYGGKKGGYYGGKKGGYYGGKKGGYYGGKKDEYCPVICGKKGGKKGHIGYYGSKGGKGGYYGSKGGYYGKKGGKKGGVYPNPEACKVTIGPCVDICVGPDPPIQPVCDANTIPEWILDAGDCCCVGGASYLKTRLDTSFFNGNKDIVGTFSLDGNPNCHGGKKGGYYGGKKSGYYDQYYAGKKGGYYTGKKDGYYGGKKYGYYSSNGAANSIYLVDCDDKCVTDPLSRTACKSISREVFAENNSQICMASINPKTMVPNYGGRFPADLTTYFLSESGTLYGNVIHTSCSQPLVKPWASVLVEACKALPRLTPINLDTEVTQNIVLAFEMGISTAYFNGAMLLGDGNEAGFLMGDCGCNCTDTTSAPTEPPTPSSPPNIDPPTPSRPSTNPPTPSRPSTDPPTPSRPSTNPPTPSQPSRPTIPTDPPTGEIIVPTPEPSLEPSSDPTFLPTAVFCIDVAGFILNNDPAKTCEWVSEDPSTRCLLRVDSDEPDTFLRVFDFCRLTCLPECRTQSPSPEPTGPPSPGPSPAPSPGPSPAPSPGPSPGPSPEPTISSPPSPHPTPYPTFKPSCAPTPYPTFKPTEKPTAYPSRFPTPRPTSLPSPSRVPPPTLEPSNEIVVPSPEPSSEPTTVPPHVSCSPSPPTPARTAVPTATPTKEIVFPSPEPSFEPPVPPHVSCSPSPPIPSGQCGEPGAESSMYDYICNIKDFKLMCLAINRVPGLSGILDGITSTDNYTLYGVMNSGMKSCDMTELNIEKASPESLKTFILGHLTNGSVKNDQLICGENRPTLARDLKTQIGCPNTGVKTISGSFNDIIKPRLMPPNNMKVCNGMIQIVDTCILIEPVITTDDSTPGQGRF